MNWDTGCENLFFHPDGPEFYPSLHSGGFRHRFNVTGIFDDPVLLTDGTFTVPRQFRVFIPPGTKMANMNFFAPSGAKIGVAQRFRNTPQLNYCGVNALNFSVMPWSGHGVLSNLEKKDHQLMNMGGSFFPLSQYFKAPGLASGGWLYIKVLDVDEANDLFQFQYVVQVYRTPYLDWYNSPQTQWDANGDPLPLTGEDSTPVPVPVPTPISVKLVGDVSSPIQFGQYVKFTAVGVGGSGKYEYRFWLLKGPGPWQSVREYSATSAWIWRPDKAGTFSVGVHVRTPGSSLAYQDVATLPYVVEGLNKLEATIKVIGKQIIITLPDAVDITILK